MMNQDLHPVIDSFFQVFKTLHQQSYHKINDKNLYPGQPKLLSLIRKQEGITQKELSGKNHVKPATITGMLNKLEASHYVYRVPDETDRRIMRVYLTPEGRQLADQAEKYMISITEQMFKNFTEEELKAFTELMEKMKNNLITSKSKE